MWFYDFIVFYLYFVLFCNKQTKEVVDTMIKQKVTKMNSRKERDVSKKFEISPSSDVEWGYWIRITKQMFMIVILYRHFITLSKWTKYITCTKADLASGPSYDLLQ